MRIIKVGDKQIHLTEKQYKILLDRTDLRFARDYCISKPCICPAFPSLGCEGCPFQLNPHFSCGQVLKKLRLHRNYIALGFAVFWEREDDRKARTEIQAMHEYLLALPKVVKNT